MSPSPASATTTSVANPPIGLVVAGGVYLHAAFLPISIAGMQIAMGVALAGLLAARLGGRRILRWTELDLPVLAFVLVAALTQALGWTRLGEAGTTTWRSLLAIPLWMAAFQLDGSATKARALRALAVWCGFALLPSLLAWPQHLLGLDLLHTLGLRKEAILPKVPLFRERYAATGFFTWYTRHAHTLTPVFCLVASFAALGGLRPRIRRLAVAASLLIGAGIFLSFARTAWYGIFAAVLLIAWFAGRRWFLVGMSVLAVSLALLVAGHQGFRDRLASSFSLSANKDRMVIWKVCASVLQEHPVVGIGFGNFREVARSRFDEVAPRLGDQFRGDCHNSFFTRLVEGGPLFLLAGLAFWLVPAAIFFRRRKAVDPTARAAAVGGLALVASLGLNAMAHDLFVSSPTSYSLGFGLVLATLLSRPTPAPSDGS